jgi:hypothetical protein
MTPTNTESLGDRVFSQRLFVLQASPNHPLSAPDPHLTLKLMEQERASAEDAGLQDDDGR